MKKEIRKMYLWAVAKVLLVILAAIVLIICFRHEELEMAAIICLSLLWGIVFLTYLISGIRTIATGAGQAREYMANSPYNMERLDEEYERARDFGRIHVGDIHVFANASDQFYVLPLRDIERVWVENHGANPLKCRKGYYYLYIQTKDVEKIKVYYAFENSAYAARDCIIYQKENGRV